jgi:hypothetical protein
MAKDKTAKASQGESGEEHYPIYVQSSNPSVELLAWIADMSKTNIVYFQSGSPIPPPPPPPPPK